MPQKNTYEAANAIALIARFTDFLKKIIAQRNNRAKTTIIMEKA
jgi:hypothetical protein